MGGLWRAELCDGHAHCSDSIASRGLCQVFIRAFENPPNRAPAFFLLAGSVSLSQIGPSASLISGRRIEVLPDRRSADLNRFDAAEILLHHLARGGGMSEFTADCRGEDHRVTSPSAKQGDHDGVPCWSSLERRDESPDQPSRQQRIIHGVQQKRAALRHHPEPGPQRAHLARPPSSMDHHLHPAGHCWEDAPHRMTQHDNRLAQAGAVVDGNAQCAEIPESCQSLRVAQAFCTSRRQDNRNHPAIRLPFAAVLASPRFRASSHGA